MGISGEVHAPFPTPLMISIAIVSSIAILSLDTYHGSRFRYRPALRRIGDTVESWWRHLASTNTNYNTEVHTRLLKFECNPNTNN